MQYAAKNGDSPLIIARTFGVTVRALLEANPHKPTTVVSGPDGRPVHTWQSLLPGETVIVPVGGMVGDAASDAISALVTAGGPCNPANVALVCAAQRALGFTVGAGVDGKWGTSDAAAAASRGVNLPACSPRPAWWTPKGQSNCPAGAAPAPTSNLTATASAALAALKADPNYCVSVSRVGSPVNAAVHNFKAAWNTANPSNRVPIGTGNYEPVVASALSSVLIGASIPPGCGAAAPAPAPAPAPSGGGAAPAPAPGAAVPAAVQALLSFDPCLQANVALVCAAQAALGAKPGAGLDGKYGVDTAAAAFRLLPSAPKACSPRPSWWTPKGQSNCPGAAQPPPAKKTETAAKTTTAAVPAVVQAIASINPCVQANSGAVYAAQSALLITADGKYGPSTAAAVRALVPSAPVACSPAPSWWGVKGTAKANQAASDAARAAVQAKADAATAAAAKAAREAAAATTQAQADAAAATAKAAAQAAADATAAAAKAAAAATTQADADKAAAATKEAAAATAAAAQAERDAAAKQAAAGGGGGGGGPIVTPPEAKKLSTGAIVAGALGAAALVGLVAVAATSGKKKHGRRHPAQRPGAHKPARKHARKSRKSTKRGKSPKRRR